MPFPTHADRLLAIESRLFTVETRLKHALGYETSTPLVPLEVLHTLHELQDIRDELYTLIDLDDLTT
jgi:hypothetical protein